MFSSQAAKPGGGLSFGGLGSTSNQSQSGGLFGNSSAAGFGQAGNTTQQQSGGLFNLNTTNQQQSQQQQGTSLFGNTQPQQQSGGLFSLGTQNKPGGSLFPTAAGQPQQTGGLFSTSTNAPQQSTWLSANPPQMGAQSAFGQSQQQQQQQTQRPLDQTLRFGQSQQGVPQGQNGSLPLWEEGRGLGVYRSIPAQMTIIKDKWDPAVLTSPLRTYLYQHVVDEGEALRYRPGPGEDETKWEEAVQRRPGSTWVPLQVRGFFELGKKAQIQMEAIQKCNMMLQEINTSLDVQLDTHQQKVASRLAECKRRHQAATRRTLALAVKVQILRNRGYVMDNAEEELKSKLDKLERDVLDPSLNAREQEVWARMLGIRERAKRLKVEMDRIAPASQDEQPLLDEETVKAAKQTLEAYDTQLRHLQKELQLVQQEFQDWEKISSGNQEDRPRRR